MRSRKKLMVTNAKLHRLLARHVLCSNCGSAAPSRTHKLHLACCNVIRYNQEDLVPGRSKAEKHPCPSPRGTEGKLDLSNPCFLPSRVRRARQNDQRLSLMQATKKVQSEADDRVGKAGKDRVV